MRPFDDVGTWEPFFGFVLVLLLFQLKKRKDLLSSERVGDIVFKAACYVQSGSQRFVDQYGDGEFDEHDDYYDYNE